MTRARLARQPEQARPLPNEPDDDPIPLVALSKPSPGELALINERAEGLQDLAGRGQETKAVAVTPLRLIEGNGTDKHERAVLTLREAAKYARRTKPNGTPRDSFYATIKRELGARRRVYRDEIDDLIEKGRL